MIGGADTNLSKPAAAATGRVRKAAIRVLSPLVANQIAAGEVVERPASVVKELVDNAIDAGARRLVVELEQGGIELVRVTDDGHGIAEDQLRLALAAHATSKINDAQDLERVATMGFRGEALASITSVSRLSLRSRTAEQPGAALIEAEGDDVRPIAPASGAVGTSVGVRNLFFNTPVRRKFLRTPATEQGKCLDIVRELAMSHPALAVTLVCDGRKAIDLPADQTPRDRVLDILGRELAPQLLEISGEDPGRGRDAIGGPSMPMTLWGMVGTPALARATTAAQHVFINGRPVRDRTIQHAIKEAFRGLIDPGRHATVVVMIDMNPAEVDVNVHPAKAEVRFRESSRPHSLVLRTIRDALRRADLTPVIGGAGAAAGTSSLAGFGRLGVLPTASPAGTDAGQLATGDERAPHERIGPTPAYQPGAAGSGGGGASGGSGFAQRFAEPGPAGNRRLDFGSLRDAVAGTGAQGGEPRRSIESLPPKLPVEEVLPTAIAAKPILQVHNSFLVTQDEQGMVIIDQHALHERVMFEKLMARIAPSSANGAPGRLESQHLLAPIVVPASPAQIDALGALAALFARIGIEAAALGPATIGVSAFPTFLFERGVTPGEFLADVLDKAESTGFAPGSEEALHEVLDMMACKAAIKAGNRLTETELRELLEMRERYERASSCPHGRPTSIRMTIAELEKRFGRT